MSHWGWQHRAFNLADQAVRINEETFFIISQTVIRF